MTYYQCIHYILYIIHPCVYIYINININVNINININIDIDIDIYSAQKVPCWIWSEDEFKCTHRYDGGVEGKVYLQCHWAVENSGKDGLMGGWAIWGVQISKIGGWHMDEGLLMLERWVKTSEHLVFAMETYPPKLQIPHIMVPEKCSPLHPPWFPGGEC